MTERWVTWVALDGTHDFNYQGLQQHQEVLQKAFDEESFGVNLRRGVVFPGMFQGVCYRASAYYPRYTNLEISPTS